MWEIFKRIFYPKKLNSCGKKHCFHSIRERTGRKRYHGFYAPGKRCELEFVRYERCCHCGYILPNYWTGDSHFFYWV
jgi:hypothetical protein